MRIEALHDTVWLRRKRTEVTEGGVVIPETAIDTAKLWEVVAVGPGAPRHGVFVETRCKPGDVVVCLAERKPMAIRDDYRDEHGQVIKLMPIEEHRIVAILREDD